MRNHYYNIREVILANTQVMMRQLKNNDFHNILETFRMQADARAMDVAMFYAKRYDNA